MQMTSAGYTEAGEVLRTVRVRFNGLKTWEGMQVSVSLVHLGAYDRRGSAVCDVRFKCRKMEWTAHGFSVGMGQVEDSKRAVAHAIDLSLAQDDAPLWLKSGAARAALEVWAAIHGE